MQISPRSPQCWSIPYVWWEAVFTNSKERYTCICCHESWSSARCSKMELWQLVCLWRIPLWCHLSILVLHPPQSLCICQDASSFLEWTKIVQSPVPLYEYSQRSRDGPAFQSARCSSRRHGSGSQNSCWVAPNHLELQLLAFQSPCLYRHLTWQMHTETPKIHIDRNFPS